MENNVLHNYRIIIINKENYIPNYEIADWLCWYICPNCKNKDINANFNYCPKCGYQINWKSLDIDKSISEE